MQGSRALMTQKSQLSFDFFISCLSRPCCEMSASLVWSTPRSRSSIKLLCQIRAAPSCQSHGAPRLQRTAVLRWRRGIDTCVMSSPWISLPMRCNIPTDAESWSSALSCARITVSCCWITTCGGGAPISDSDLDDEPYILYSVVETASKPRDGHVGTQKGKLGKESPTSKARSIGLVQSSQVKSRRLKAPKASKQASKCEGTVEGASGVLVLYPDSRRPGER